MMPQEHGEDPGAKNRAARKCDICGKSEATLRVRRVSKAGRADIEICAECAKARGLAEARKIDASVPEILADIAQSVDQGDEALVCSGCGMSFAEFKRKGRLGCACCYRAFDKELRPLVRRLQGAVSHVGRTAKTGRRRARNRMTLVRLRAELKAAIAAEDYEQAARLRDELGKAESNAGS